MYRTADLACSMPALMIGKQDQVQVFLLKIVVTPVLYLTIIGCTRFLMKFGSQHDNST